MILFLKAFLTLLTYDLAIRLGGFKTVYSMVRKWKIAQKQTDQALIDRVCRAVDYACVCYPKRALCLQRCFATTFLLRKEGIPAEMVLGAQKLPFKAHAWVEVCGRAVNERSNVQSRYAVWDRC